MAKRVWILGAGFSRSLGAPLLNDLLSFRLRSALGHHGKLTDLVYSLYHYGRNFPEGYAFTTQHRVPRGENRWRDAEHFLEELDQCASDGEKGDRRLDAVRMRMSDACTPKNNPTLVAMADMPIGHLVGPLHGFLSADLLREAKRIIAAEVCEFMERPSRERLMHYQEWFKQLTCEDTIVTFNYDTLVEYVATSVERPVNVMGADPNAQRIAAPSAPELLKLHGSVDWAKDPGSIIGFTRTDNPKYAVEYPEDGQLCTPGSSKLELREGCLQPLWIAAGNAIREARQVYILGCRVPESDASVSQLVLRGLRRTSSPLSPVRPLGPQFAAAMVSWKVPVKIALGSATHPDRTRLMNKLKNVAEAEDTGLGAEDFIGDWSPDPEPSAPY